MKKLLILILCVFSVNVEASEIYKIETEVVIYAPIEKVFAFAGNAINDKAWRKEVRSVESEGSFQSGTKYVEKAILGFHWNYKTETELIDLFPPFKAVYRTTEENPYRLISERTFEKVSTYVTKFKYHVEVEEDLVKDIWNNTLSPKLAVAGYEKLMNMYLKKLKDMMENE